MIPEYKTLNVEIIFCQNLWTLVDGFTRAIEHPACDTHTHTHTAEYVVWQAKWTITDVSLCNYRHTAVTAVSIITVIIWYYSFVCYKCQFIGIMQCVYYK